MSSACSSTKSSGVQNQRKPVPFPNCRVTHQNRPEGHIPHWIGVAPIADKRTALTDAPQPDAAVLRARQQKLATPTKAGAIHRTTVAQQHSVITRLAPGAQSHWWAHVCPSLHHMTTTTGHVIHIAWQQGPHVQGGVCKATAEELGGRSK